MVITRRALVVSLLFGVSLGFGRNAREASAASTSKSSEAYAAPTAKIRTATADLSAWVAQRNGQLSLYVGTLDSRTAVTTFNGDRPLNPASNTKLLTMLTALHELGPEYRFSTNLCGRLDGETVETLGIVGNGDPTLDRAAVLDLAFQLVEQGVRQVKRIVVDQSAFDDDYTPPAFEQQPNEWSAFRAPVSAVAFEGNSVSVSVSPTQVTKLAKVTVFPASFLDLVVTARTRRANEKASAVEVAASSEKGRLKLRVAGTISDTAETITLSRRVDDPRTFAGHALADSLRAVGVQLPRSASVEVGKCESAMELAHRTSPALVAIMHQLGKDSDNFVAEMLVKAIGAHATGKPGTTTDGLAAVQKFTSSIHQLASGTRLVNGSGLFDANRVSAEQLVAVLRYALNDTRLGPEFVSSLAVAGRDGTLRKRFAAVPWAVIRAKTGSLKQVASLSGYLQASNSASAYVFSVIINDVDSGEARQKIDAFVLHVLEAIRG